MKKRTVFIIPYFGKFNNYFQLFLNSCGFNKQFDWLIFTDDKRLFSYPQNVKVKYVTFEWMRQLIQSKFDIPVLLNYPYKLCDYKPAYGYIFSEYITEYAAWGHCDTDMIFGNLSKYISDEDIIEYDKIGVLGHCTIYKNTYDINTAFMKSFKGNFIYQDVYTTDKNFSFDEEFNCSINNIFEENGYKIRYEEYEANIYTKSSNLKLTKLDMASKTYLIEKKTNSIFVFNEGSLERYTKKESELHKEEYMYIHLQSRPMKVKVNISSNLFKIIPNSFDRLEVSQVDINNFNKIKKKHVNLHYFKLRSKNLYKKIMKKLGKRV